MSSIAIPLIVAPTSAGLTPQQLARRREPDAVLYRRVRAIRNHLGEALGYAVEIHRGGQGLAAELIVWGDEVQQAGDSYWTAATRARERYEAFIEQHGAMIE